MVAVQVTVFCGEAEQIFGLRCLFTVISAFFSDKRFAWATYVSVEFFFSPFTPDNVITEPTSFHKILEAKLSVVVLTKRFQVCSSLLLRCFDRDILAALDRVVVNALLC